MSFIIRGPDGYLENASPEMWTPDPSRAHQFGTISEAMHVRDEHFGGDKKYKLIDLDKPAKKAQALSIGWKNAPTPRRRQPVQAQLPALTPKQLAKLAKKPKKRK